MHRDMKSSENKQAVETLEAQLDDFDPGRRSAALDRLIAAAEAGQVELPPASDIVNMHGHTFYSYNAYGFSPTRFAWTARRLGFHAAGIVDFDVLDGLEEFFAAAARLDLRGTGGVESRVFVPEFADRVINSPGEPGVAYHMGVGFTCAHLSGPAATYLRAMRSTAERRNREMVTRVNTFMAPVEIDYDKDLLPLTPAGNATERHICMAYSRAAARRFPEPTALAAFWSEKLGTPADKLDLPEGGALQNALRAKTMKRGGVGYVQPGPDSFPLMADMNAFTLSCGAIPTLAWLDGTTAGEQAMEELLGVAMACGVAAVNLIPDRNYTPGVSDQKLKNLYDFVALAEKHDLPVLVGTELNSPGNKLVDRFDTAEIQPLVPAFLRGADILYAHTALQRALGLGYLSTWAEEHFENAKEKNAFYAKVGRALRPSLEARLEGLPMDIKPGALLEKIRS